MRGWRGSLLVIGAWTCIALIAAIIGWQVLLAQLQREMREAERDALQDAAVMARAYARNLFRSLEAIDQLSLYVKHGFESSQGQLTLSRIGELDNHRFETALHVTILDTEGWPLSSTLPGIVSGNFYEEAFFAVQRTFGNRGFLYIGPPDTRLVPGRTVFPFSRRLLNVDGSFAGVVVVTVGNAYFLEGYDQLTLKDKGFLGVVRSDGGLQAGRLGHDILSVTREESWNLSNDLNGSAGARLVRNLPDRRPRFLAWQRTEEFDMTAVVGLDREETLAPTLHRQEKALSDARLATLGLFMLTALAVLVHLSVGRRSEQLSRLASTYRTATEGGLEGFFILSPVRGKNERIRDFVISDCNARGAEFVKYRPEQLKGKRVTEVFRGDAGAETMRMLKAAARDRLHEGEVELSRYGGLEGIWVHIKVTRPEDDLAVTMRDITSSKAQVSALEKQSYEDALTCLPNRHWLNSYFPPLLEHLKSNQQLAAVLFIDLDGFKAVNDTLGHETGDEVLRHAGLRLRDAVRPHDTVVRIGGDEFLVVLERVGNIVEATQVAQRIIDGFRQPFGSPKGEVAVGASIGIAAFPRDGTTADDLLRAADSAMYAVKASGKNQFMFYDKHLAEAALAKQALEKDLRVALEQDELTVYYQPRISPFTGHMESMEALVRWRHPSKGLLEPLQFISLAEEAGLIVPLGEVVIRKVCQQLAAWRRTVPEAIPVSINVSPLQLRDSGFASALRLALQTHDVPAHLVEIEITETAMTDLGHPRIASSVAGIRELGCRLVVDDFGTGYSSLSRLQDLDCDVLKVDRAFTGRLAKSEKGAALFAAIIGMAHALDMIVVAEGVETTEQLLELQRLGCDEVQGYLFSRPLPASNSAEFFSNIYAV